MRNPKPVQTDPPTPCLAPGSEGFSAVVRRWQADLYRFFRLLGAGKHEAEDHVQETFLRLFRSRRRYGLESMLHGPALVYRVARTVFLDSLRRSRRRPPCVSLGALRGEPPSASRPTVGVAELLDLRAAVSELPEKLRWVVILNVYQGLEYRDVARALGIPIGTVKSRMHLALRSLREKTYGRVPL